MAKFYGIDTTKFSNLSLDAQKIAVLEILDGLIPRTNRENGFQFRPDASMNESPALIGNHPETGMSIMFDSDPILDFNPLISAYRLKPSAQENYQETANIGLAPSQQNERKDKILMDLQGKAYEKSIHERFYNNQENLPENARADQKTIRRADNIQKSIDNKENYQVSPKELQILERVKEHRQAYEEFKNKPENSFEQFLKEPTLDPEVIQRNSPYSSDINIKDEF